VPYTIRFSPEADEHIAALTAHQRATLFDRIERQLTHQPTVETRNRKRMKATERIPLAPWELRVGDLRVYHEVEEGPVALVIIAAVGEKVRNRVRIGGIEVEP
jgi:mRNA-degrading endonuclease RelE of RelBE toxin-antitoxin system